MHGSGNKICPLLIVFLKTEIRMQQMLQHFVAIRAQISDFVRPHGILMALA